MRLDPSRSLPLNHQIDNATLVIVLTARSPFGFVEAASPELVEDLADVPLCEFTGVKVRFSAAPRIYS